MPLTGPPQSGIVRTAIKAQFLKRRHRRFQLVPRVAQQNANQDFDMAFSVVIGQQSDHETRKPVAVVVPLLSATTGANR